MIARVSCRIGENSPFLEGARLSDTEQDGIPLQTSSQNKSGIVVLDITACNLSYHPIRDTFLQSQMFRTYYKMHVVMKGILEQGYGELIRPT